MVRFSRQGRFSPLILGLLAACTAPTEPVGSTDAWLEEEVSEDSSSSHTLDSFEEALVAASGQMGFTGTGLVLHVRAGRYTFDTETFDPDCTTCGWTPVTGELEVRCEPGTVIVRDGSTDAPLFDFSDMHDVAVVGCELEVEYASGTPAVPRNGNVGIRFDEGDGLLVQQCAFRTTEEPGSSHDQFAVDANGATNVRVVQNRVEHMGFRFQSDLGATEDLTLNENVLTSPYGHAVSARGGTYALRRVQILDNIVHHVPATSAIEVGFGAEASAIHVAGNSVVGEFRVGAVSGIVLGTGTVTRTWTIAENMVVNENVATMASTGVANGYGIRLQGSDPARLVHVTNNVVGGVAQPGTFFTHEGGFNKPGISVELSGSDISIADNLVTDSRSLQVLVGAGGVSRLSVSGNVVSGRGAGLHIESTHSSTGDGFYATTVSDNTFEVYPQSFRYAISRRLDGLEPFDVYFVGNALVAPSPAGAWGGDNPSDEVCVDNVRHVGGGMAATPADCPNP